MRHEWGLKEIPEVLSFSLPNVYIPHKVFFESLATICRSLKLETSQSRFLDCPVFLRANFFGAKFNFYQSTISFRNIQLVRVFREFSEFEFWEALGISHPTVCHESWGKKLGKPIERSVKDIQTWGHHSTLASGPNCSGFDSHSSWYFFRMKNYWRCWG